MESRVKRSTEGENLWKRKTDGEKTLSRKAREECGERPSEPNNPAPGHHFTRSDLRAASCGSDSLTASVPSVQARPGRRLVRSRCFSRPAKESSKEADAAGLDTSSVSVKEAPSKSNLVSDQKMEPLKCAKRDANEKRRGGGCSCECSEEQSPKLC